MHEGAVYHSADSLLPRHEIPDQWRKNARVPTLQFAPKASRLPPLGETKYVERVEKTPEKNAQA
jgi:hypothetical protein